MRACLSFETRGRRDFSNYFANDPSVGVKNEVFSWIRWILLLFAVVMSLERDNDGRLDFSCFLCIGNCHETRPRRKLDMGKAMKSQNGAEQHDIESSSLSFSYLSPSLSLSAYTRQRTHIRLWFARWNFSFFFNFLWKEASTLIEIYVYVESDLIKSGSLLESVKVHGNHFVFFMIRRTTNAV